MAATLPRSRGFTLIELLVTVAVATIFLAVVPGSFTSILKSVRVKAQMYDFNGALDFARSEAVKRGAYVTVCPSTDQATCGPSGTNWEAGWIVFTDPNNNHTVDAGEGPPLRASTALLAQYTLRGTSATTLPNYITFSAKGAPSASGVFILCMNGNIKPSRAILVGTSGRITAATDDNGVPMTSGGTDMTTCTP
jgi:type IV fimbrial biogenesis protein FimT